MDSSKLQKDCKNYNDKAQEENLDETWTSLPPEVFTTIYGFFGSIGPQHVFDQDDHCMLISVLRLVCKTWRDLIDENINFVDVLVNDVTLSGSGIKHLRVKSCRVDDLTVEVPRSQPLSREPNLLTDISLLGIITPENLIWLSNQTPNLKVLRMNYYFIRNSVDQIFLVTIPNEEPILNCFWNRIEQLHLECGDIRLSTTSDLEKLTSILLSTMPNLKLINLLTHWNAATYQLLINFLLRHPKVLYVHLDCRGEGSRLYSFDKMQKYETSELEKIQLKTFTINTGCSEIGREFLIEFVKIQRSLLGLSFEDWTPSGSLFLNALNDVIEMNLSSLTDLSLTSGCFDGTLNARLFQKMTALKSLVIWTQDELTRPNHIPKIVTLACLPVSLEKFEVDRFACQKEDLLKMCTAHRLDNIRTLKLFGVGDSVITPELLDILLRKEKLRGLKLCPLDLKLFRTQETGQRKYVKIIISKDGHILPVKVWRVAEPLGFHLKVNCKFLRKTSQLKFEPIIFSLNE